MDLYKDGPNLCLGQMLTDSGHMLITTDVEAGVTYRLEITNLSGSGKYFVRCKNNPGAFAIMNKLKKDTSLGWTSEKKDTLIKMGTALLESEANFDLAFIAGLLGNISHEGNVGQFESSNYVSNPSAKPEYLIKAEELGYKEFSGKNITSKGLRATKTLIDACAKTNYTAKFGLGCVQWTGGRTMNLINCYLGLFNIDADIDLEDCYLAEGTFIAEELSNNPDFTSIYPNWYKNYSNKDNAAYEAGKIVCLQYEKPRDPESKYDARGNTSQNIYNILIS